MFEYLDSIEPILLQRTRRKISTSPGTNAELRDLRALEGKLNVLGHAALSKAYLLTWKIQKSTHELWASDLALSNNSPRSFKKLTLWINFFSPVIAPAPDDCIIQTFADTDTGSAAYGQKWLVTGLLVKRRDGSEEQIFHPLLWHYSKQERNCFSSVRTEILAATDAGEKSLHLCDCLTLILQNDSSFPILLSFDSYGIY